MDFDRLNKIDLRDHFGFGGNHGALKYKFECLSGFPAVANIKDDIQRVVISGVDSGGILGRVLEDKCIICRQGDVYCGCVDTGDEQISTKNFWHLCSICLDSYYIRKHFVREREKEEDSLCPFCEYGLKE